MGCRNEDRGSEFDEERKRFGRKRGQREHFGAKTNKAGKDVESRVSSKIERTTQQDEDHEVFCSVVEIEVVGETVDGESFVGQLKLGPKSKLEGGKEGKRSDELTLQREAPES